MTRSARSSADPVDVRRLGLVDYTEGWDLQHKLADDRASGALDRDALLLLEHPAVFTAGRRTQAQDRPAPGTPVVDVDRGGKITWHGPGQLVGYPIVALAEPVDVVNYVRRLEEALIAVCAELGVETGRIEGRSGVWLSASSGFPERKVAAIGIRVQKGVALHGFALNCDNTLDGFSAIIPCGIPDAGVTTLSRELGRDVQVADVIDLVEAKVLAALEGALPVENHDLPRGVPFTL